MAIRIAAQASARPAAQATGLPPVVLAIALVPAALDLLRMVQPGLVGVLNTPTSVAAAVSAAVLLAMWLRFPRTSWLLAASFAACASLALRLVGADVGPALSLLSILALGVGGAFVSSEVSPVDALG
jgi:hypothetical protein